MPTTDRWVVVDDTISNINYIGDSWFADVGSQDATDNGPPFLSSLHGTNTSANLIFNFTGSAVVVMGTNLIRNDSGVVDPQWSCYVDGVPIYSVPPFQYPENNWGLCSSYSLTGGSHTITVNATVAKNQTFWFDRIDYLPSTSVSLANKTILLTSADPAIRYGTGWSAYADLGNWTQTQGALFTLNFYGTSLSWSAIVGGVIGGVAFVLVPLVLYVLYRRRRQQSEKEMTTDEPATDYIPTPQVIPSSSLPRLPAKLSEEQSRRRNFLSRGPSSPGPSGLSLEETATDPARSPTNSDDWVTGPASLVLHQDSGTRLPVVIPEPLDIPPVYTPD